MNEEMETALKVEIKEHAYNPPEATVKKNMAVEFENLDEDLHSVTAEADSFDLELATGQSEKIGFKDTGEYGYYCRYHPEMRGTIIVEE